MIDQSAVQQTIEEKLQLKYLSLNKIQQYSRKVEIARSYNGINAFNELVLRDRYNRPIVQGQIHKFWNWFIDTCLANGQKKIGVAAPMEHGKTSQISIGRILHLIGLNPNIRIKLVSCIDGKATEKTSAVKRIIQYSKDYKRIFPNVHPNMMDSWTTHRLVVNRDVLGMVDATLESQSITAQGIGGRCDALVMDDVVDFQNSATEAVRRKIRDLAMTTWMTRIDDSVIGKYEGIALYIGTAWHEDDLMHYWMQPGSNFTFLKMGISQDFECIEWEILNGDHIFGREDIGFEDKPEFLGKTEGLIPLWKEKPKEVLMGKYQSDEEGEGARYFDRAYRNKFVSSDEQIFYTIHECKDSTLDMEDVMNEDSWYSFMGVDLAISKRKDSAYTVFVVGKMDHKGKKYLADVIRGKFSSPSTAAIALALGAMYRIEVGIIENNAYQQSMLEWIEVFRDELELKPIRGMTEQQIKKQEIGLEEKLDKKYSKFFSKDKDFTPALWAYLKPYLMECGRTIISFRPYTTGKTLFDEKVGLPVFAAEIQSRQWIVPWYKHLQDDRLDYCRAGCDICAALKEMVGYPGAKYKDCLMAWFFCSRAMKTGQFRIRSF